MNKKIDILILNFIVFLILFLYFIVNVDKYLDLPFIGIEKEKVLKYNTEWQFEFEDKKIEKIVLPHKENVPLMKKYIYKNVFPNNFDKGNVLAFRTMMQNVQILVNNNVVLDLNNNKAKTNNCPLGTYWVFYKIPKNFLDKEFKIVLESNYDNYSGYLSDVFLIYDGQQLSFLIDNDYTILFFTIGIVILILYLIISDFLLVREKKDYSVFCFGIFILNIIFWAISESGMMIFLTNKTYLLTRLQYDMLCLLQLTAFMWLDFNINHSYKKYTKYLGIFVFFNTISLLMLSFYNLIENKLFIKINHYIIGIIFIIYIFIYIKEYKKTSNKIIKIKILLLFIVAFFSFLSLFFYYGNNRVDMRYFSRIGLIFAMSVFLFSYYKNHIYSKNLYLEKIYLSKIAYKDDLTGAYNRTAFNIDVDKKLDKYIIISYDCNNLKQVNDSLGHIYGDEVIINTYICIHNSFGEYGKTYRMGGDEFITIIDKNIDKINIELLKDKFYEEINKIQNKVKYDFSISIGLYIANDGIPIEEAMKKSDKLMYDDKFRYKNKNY